MFPDPNSGLLSKIQMSDAILNEAIPRRWRWPVLSVCAFAIVLFWQCSNVYFDLGANIAMSASLAIWAIYYTARLIVFACRSRKENAFVEPTTWWYFYWVFEPAMAVILVIISVVGIPTAIRIKASEHELRKFADQAVTGGLEKIRLPQRVGWFDVKGVTRSDDGVPLLALGTDVFSSFGLAFSEVPPKVSFPYNVEPLTPGVWRWTRLDLAGPRK